MSEDQEPYIAEGSGRPLTKKQTQVLEAIRASVAAKGFAPTLGELCRAMGTTSQGSMVKHLDALQDRGLLVRGGGSRRIVLKDRCPYCGR